MSNEHEPRPPDDGGPTYGREVEMVAELAEPTRRRIFEFISASGEALSREQVAESAGLPIHTAKFHLDKLLAEGLLAVEFRKLTGREGPGSGRPTKHYRRAEGEISISIPARQYDLLSRILANAVATAATTGEAVGTIASTIARKEGEEVGRAHKSRGGDDLSRVSSALTTTGYEPQLEDPNLLALHNCPFHKAAQEQTDLVCGLNLDFVSGVCTGLEARSARAALKPVAGRCCVTVSAADLPAN